MRKKHKKTAAYLLALAVTGIAVFSNGKAYAAGTDPMPAKFDLRDYGYVTPVKFQNPWGTCWGFSSIAAAETSILGELGISYTEFKEKYGIDMDLSEKHLAYFAATPMPDTTSQAGEGIHVIDKSQTLDIGGMLITTANMFSGGIGPYFESNFPYYGKDKVIDYYYYDASNKFLAVKNTPDDPSVSGYTKVIPVCYSKNDDWTVSEDYRFGAALQLEESKILNPPTNSDGSMNVDALNKMKQELLNKRGIAIQFFSSETRADSLGNVSQYYNKETGAHYVSDLGTGATHGVTIVGYDDNYPKENFAITPPGDGAWIVKNSWGAADNEFPNKYNWGYNNTGYFYLSYYDHSVAQPETYDFDVEGLKISAPTFIIDEYDFMPGTYTLAAMGNEEKTSFANVFVAEKDEIVTQVSLDVPVPNAEVTVSVYSLGKNFDSILSGEKVFEKTQKYEDAGYHRIDVEKSFFIAKGESYSVVATVKDANGMYYLSYRNNLSLAGQEYMKTVNPQWEIKSYAVGVVNKGESFTVLNGKIEDFTDFATDYFRESLPIISFDNFSIKSYASPNSGTVGKNIEYVIDEDGILTISGTGNTEKYTEHFLTPWYFVRDFIKKVKIAKNVVPSDGLFMGIEDVEVIYEDDIPAGDSGKSPFVWALIGVAGLFGTVLCTYGKRANR